MTARRAEDLALAEAYAARRAQLVGRYRTADPGKLREKLADLWDVGAAELIALFEENHRPRIHRGIVAQATDVPLERAQRIADGTATLNDILTIVDVENPGCWWWSETEGFGIPDARERAFGEETVDKWIGLDRDDGKATTHFELPAVLSGYGPVGWTSEDNPDEGLMGNSYIPDGGKVRITAVHYSPDGDRWLTIPADREVTIGSAAGPGREHADERDHNLHAPDLAAAFAAASLVTPAQRPGSRVRASFPQLQPSQPAAMPTGPLTARPATPPTSRRTR